MNASSKLIAAAAVAAILSAPMVRAQQFAQSGRSQTIGFG
jgi:hypothetical protein